MREEKECEERRSASREGVRVEKVERERERERERREGSASREGVLL